MARYLVAAGWEPTVLTMLPESSAELDHEAPSPADIPEAVRVQRTKGWNPDPFYARMLGEDQHTSTEGNDGHPGANLPQRIGQWVQKHVFLPSASVAWVPSATWAARALLTEQRFDAILTTGPPHSVHLVGRSLARRSRLPWVADFGEPWAEDSFCHKLSMSLASRWMEAHYERSVFEEADAVVGGSPEQLQCYSHRNQSARLADLLMHVVA